MNVKTIFAASALALSASIFSSAAFAGPMIDAGKAKALQDAMNGNKGTSIDPDKAAALQDAMNNGIYIDPKTKGLFKKKKHKPNLNIYVGGISCGYGKQIVRNYGFRKVRPLNCGGRMFTYLGRQGGESYAIMLSRSGRIINVDELGY